MQAGRGAGCGHTWPGACRVLLQGGAGAEGPRGEQPLRPCALFHQQSPGQLSAERDKLSERGAIVLAGGIVPSPFTRQGALQVTPFCWPCLGLPGTLGGTSEPHTPYGAVPHGTMVRWGRETTGPRGKAAKCKWMETNREAQSSTDHTAGLSPKCTFTCTEGG